ncbi:hypothetical protein [Primorskyibacter sedentarius]|uniref:hypothetical protein n=1 Tax=Primorskyibacter sedentarius TaxID=745311 RepID=UPI0010451806|nr:hypothetical protein [Primorskyibacter sedentarius]
MTDPPVIPPVASTMRGNDRAMIGLPQPDPPRTQSVRLANISKLTPSAAFTTPQSVKKPVRSEGQPSGNGAASPIHSGIVEIDHRNSIRRRIRLSTQLSQ